MPPQTLPLEFEGETIVLGVTGGISAYKAIELCRLLTKSGAHVIPVLTASAIEMVGRKSFDVLASEPAKTDFWSDSERIPHTHLGQTADLVLVCPATARVVSDLATARSADLLSATLISTEAPIVVCPAMHTEMWNNPGVQHNIKVLADRGVTIVPPEVGPLAGGDSGVGRLASLDTVLHAVASALGAAKPLSGKSVLVTAGGTREPIDPVRFIGNRSSGKQGHAFAEQARVLGADVTLVTTSSIESSPTINRIDVTTSDEMHQAVTKNRDADLVIMTAAVADFKPSTVLGHKLKKSAGVPTLELEPTVDILATLTSEKKAGQIVVGFAAETDDFKANASKKLAEKSLDYIVLNNVLAPQTGFGYDTNEVSVISADGSLTEIQLTTKRRVARAVLDIVIADSTGSQKKVRNDR